MPEARTHTLLCLACYFKGEAFMRAAKAEGARVLLVTSQHLSGEPWPWDVIDDVFYMPDHGDHWDLDDLVKSVSYLARRERIDKIVALDDYDVERAAALREHLRIPGMGDTTARYFRDKLAMRTRAEEAGLPVPAFEHVLNHARLRLYLEATHGPWVVKPRSQASATGIKKVKTADEFWQVIDGLGDQQSFYLVERFVPGAVYHVDSVVKGYEARFARAHRYLDTPMQVAHEGGIFATQTVEYDSDLEKRLLEFNKRVIAALGLREGIAHTEFIEANEDGTLYFLETSARVGGAHIAELVEASSGINLWTEWARMILLGESYTVPAARTDHAGLLISLARQEHPDLSGYDDKEIVWRMDKKNHAGLIVRAKKQQRVQKLLDAYIPRFRDDFLAVVPLPDSPTS